MFIISWPNVFDVETSTFFGVSFSFIFLETFFDNSNAEEGISSDEGTWSFGIIIMWPFDRGFSSRTAIESLFSDILYDSTSSETIEQKIQFVPSCPELVNWPDLTSRLFFFKNSSSCSESIDSIWLFANSFLSSGKLFSMFWTSCSFIASVCSGVSVIELVGEFI